jgi:hypothetical protein
MYTLFFNTHILDKIGFSLGVRLMLALVVTV